MKREEIEAMRDKAMASCTTYDTMRDFVVRACDALTEQRWIPVTERLPEGGFNTITQKPYAYLATVELHGKKDVGYYHFCNGHWYNGDSVPLDNLVIAWMPLPDAYQGSRTKEGDHE